MKMKCRDNTASFILNPTLFFSFSFCLCLQQLPVWSDWRTNRMNSWITISLAESPSLCWMLNYWNSRNPGLASESNIFYLLALFLNLVSLVPRRFITGYSCILLIYCCLFISYSSISFCLIYFLWGKTCLLCLVNGLKISLDRTTKTWSYFCNYYYILHIHFFNLAFHGHWLFNTAYFYLQLDV